MKVSYILLFFNFLGFVQKTFAGIDIFYARPSPAGPGVFGVNDQCGPRISTAIAAANDKVRVSMYTLTSPELIRKLKDKAATGKKVCVLIDKYQYNNCIFPSGDSMKNRINNLKTGSPTVKVRLLGSGGSSDKMMHEKVAIFSNVDGNHTAVLGSYNWTYSASKEHFENCIFLKTEGIDSINAAIGKVKTRFDVLWRLSSSLNGVAERDLDCLFTPTPDEQKILKDAAAVRSDERGGRGKPSPGGPSSDSRSGRKPMPPSKSSGEGAATPLMKRVAMGPSSNPGGFSASVSFSPAAATFSSPRSRKVRFDESSRKPLLSIKDKIAEAEEKAVVESLPPIPVGNKGISRAFLSPGKSPVMTRGQREEHGRELVDEE